MPIINIGKAISFSANNGVFLHKEALDLTPDRLSELVKLAFTHMQDEELVDACCGGIGPLSQYSQLEYEDYLKILGDIKIEKAGRLAKSEHTKIRRKEFNANRSGLVLAMLDARIPYKCAHPGCSIIAELTVDHIKPLSRGGTDEVSNLRFLCRSHNSQKSDR